MAVCTWVRNCFVAFTRHSCFSLLSCSKLKIGLRGLIEYHFSLSVLSYYTVCLRKPLNIHCLANDAWQHFQNPLMSLMSHSDNNVGASLALGLIPAIQMLTLQLCSASLFRFHIIRVIEFLKLKVV